MRRYTVSGIFAVTALVAATTYLIQVLRVTDEYDHILVTNVDDHDMEDVEVEVSSLSDVSFKDLTSLKSGDIVDNDDLLPRVDEPSNPKHSIEIPIIKAGESLTIPIDASAKGRRWIGIRYSYQGNGGTFEHGFQLPPERTAEIRIENSTIDIR